MRSRLTITLQSSLLAKLDKLVDRVRIRNRSHAIEYLLNKSLGNQEVTAVVLAGGEGTRLRPFTFEVPKSLLPVNGKPLIGYLLAQLHHYGINEVIVLPGKQLQKFENSLGGGERWGVKLKFPLENEPLGTGGALRIIQKMIGHSPFILVYGDIYTQIDFQELLSFHQQSGALVTMALKVVNDPRQFGQVLLQGQKVTKFFRTPQEGRTNLINLGIYVCSSEIFSFFPSGKHFNFEDLLVNLVANKQVNGYVNNEEWFDVGTPADYERVIKKLS